ncbi:hypothetical protein K0H71_19375 [Bacillus sp. IITD106]|nr:hypothetical protein [Bacillus sp. IITD106]
MLSYDEFIKQVKSRLNTFSDEELQTIIMDWASQESPSNRQSFLEKLNPNKGVILSSYDAETLINEIEHFAKRVEDGDYCDGYGWDDEIRDERDFGDESWAEEMDDLLLEARGMLMAGNAEVAESAYRRLFEVLGMGEEPGHLPGDLDPTNMLDVDLGEHIALFLRSIYMNTNSNERVNVVYNALKEYSYFASSQITLKSIASALDSELPDFDLFLEDSIHFFKKHQWYNSNDLLREAVFLKGGIPAISEFARKNADTYPKAYKDWIIALESMSSSDSTIIEVTKEGLANIPVNFIVRAEVAEFLIKIGDKLHNDCLMLEGQRERFYSNPTMNHLVELYVTAIKYESFDAIRELVEKRISQLQNAGMTGREGYSQDELRMSSVSDGIYLNSLLFAGKHELAFELCSGEGSVGWSYGENPKPIFITFLMVVLSKQEKLSYVLEKEWYKAIANTCYSSGEGYINHYREIIYYIINSISLSQQQEELYLKWCMKEIGKRVDAIVSNQYRGSYDKAAGLLVAMAETLTNRGNRQEGLKFIEKYRSKYPRHTSFKKEIASAIKISILN